MIQGSDFTGNVHPDSEFPGSPGNHRKLYKLVSGTYLLATMFDSGCFTRMVSFG
ncbi:MAG: hypothetical protein K8S14_08390 [Actinomycetia bacterium]|nr:hypothetical protein [Actinomycetes bacterium]